VVRKLRTLQRRLQIDTRPEVARVIRARGEAVKYRSQDRVPRSFGDARMKGDIRLQKLISGCCAIHLIEALEQRPQLFGGHARASPGSGRTFQHGTQLQQLHHFMVAHELHRKAGRLQQQRCVETCDENALAVTDLEDAHHFQPSNCLAYGTA
jgi:hypothetical protein